MDHFVCLKNVCQEHAALSEVQSDHLLLVFRFLILDSLWQFLSAHVCVGSRWMGARAERWPSLKCALSASGNWSARSVTGERTGFEFHPLGLMLLCCVMTQCVADERAHVVFFVRIVSISVYLLVCRSHCWPLQLLCSQKCDRYQCWVLKGSLCWTVLLWDWFRERRSPHSRT